MIDPDQIQRLRRLRKACEYRHAATAPLFAEIARIRLIHTRFSFVIYPDGRTVNTSTLPDFAQRWVDDLEKSVKLAGELAVKIVGESCKSRVDGSEMCGSIGA